MNGEVYVLVFRYLDGSGFYVCGATCDEAIANAWKSAGHEHRVFKGTMDFVVPFDVGLPEWT